MKTLKFDKSVLFLILILIVVAGVAITAVFLLRTNEVDAALENDQILKMLFVIDDGPVPLSTDVLFYYPATRRSALFDIPAETGLIISSLNRVDGIGVLFKQSNPGPYRDEISKLLSTEIPLYFVFSLESLSGIVDLLEGIELFVPNAIDLDIEGRTLLFPQGTALFDGDKVRAYVSYLDPNETEIDAASRRQRVFISLLKRISEKSEYLSRKDVLARFAERVKTNISKPALGRLIDALTGIDAERIVPSRVQGTVRNVEGKSLLFPHYDGELLKDIVRQNLNALVSDSSGGGAERIYTMEILNGTNVKGLAKRTAALFESFGYEVLSFGNADSDDIEKTALLDRFGSDEVARTVAQVIKCVNISPLEPNDAGPETGADFVLVIGKDFNGRYCIP